MTVYIALSDKILSPSKSVKYLGVHLDEHLNWKTHTATVATKLRRANGALQSPSLVFMFPPKLLLMSTTLFLLLTFDMRVKSGGYVIIR